MRAQQTQQSLGTASVASVQSQQPARIGKRFRAKISDNEVAIESAMDLNGYSHVSQPRKETCLYYPFERYVRDVFFTARNMREAHKNAQRRIPVGYYEIREA